ncbi:hypothetical protein EV361DRAFT_936141 [Lentinula raphanica]|nr:hypothetical protein EV361DRAFT_936141 [Lentinula raphanica]
MAPAQTLTDKFFEKDSGKQLKPNKANAYEDSVAENYNGKYRFAPIQEAEVSRAMIKR